MFGFKTEPAVIAGAIRAIILAAVSFGLNWTGDQVAALMLAVEAVLTLIVRQNVTSQSTLEQAGLSQAGVAARADINRDNDAKNKLPMILLAAVIGGSLLVSGCALRSGNVSPERRVAQYGTQIKDAISAAQALAKDLHTGKVITNEQYAASLKVFIRVNEAGERLGDALLAYDAATSVPDAETAARQIDAALVTLGTLLPDVFGEVSSPDARAKIGAIIGQVQQLIVNIARFTAPRAAQILPYPPRGCNGCAPVAA